MIETVFCGSTAFREIVSQCCVKKESLCIANEYYIFLQEEVT
jgi:hypothetical protein